jgi:hypothetical protein
MTVLGPPSIDGPPELLAFAGSSFHFNYFSMSGTPAPTASLSGDVPSWLHIDPATATLSGIPASGGEFKFTIIADNGVEPAASLPVTLLVNEEAHISGQPPVAPIGQPYSFQFAVTGWPTPTVVLEPGSTLPPGFSLSTSGVLSGTPTQTGIFDFIIVANGFDLAELPVQLTVAEVAPTITGSSEHVGTCCRRW